jgi:hypothetical protein
MHPPDAAGVGLQVGEDSRYMQDNASTAPLCTDSNCVSLDAERHPGKQLPGGQRICAPSHDPAH